MYIQNLLYVNDNEAHIFNIILDMCDKYDISNTICVTGKWVKNKVLHLESNHINISVQDILGDTFVKQFLKYLTNDLNFDTSTIIVNSNNFQIDIFGKFITFTNFKNSDEKCCSPQEDALSRDFTINSLFYNIRTGHVEDWTKKAFLHIKNKILTTITNPSHIFNKNPLLLLRCVKLYSKHNDFIIHKDILNCLNNKLRDALSSSLEKDLIKKEVNQIIISNRSLQALKILHKMKLLSLVFCYGDMNQINITKNNSILDFLNSVKTEYV